MRAAGRAHPGPHLHARGDRGAVRAAARAPRRRARGARRGRGGGCLSRGAARAPCGPSPCARAHRGCAAELRSRRGLHHPRLLPAGARRARLRERGAVRRRADRRSGRPACRGGGGLLAPRALRRLAAVRRIRARQEACAVRARGRGARVGRSAVPRGARGGRAHRHGGVRGGFRRRLGGRSGIVRLARGSRRRRVAVEEAVAQACAQLVAARDALSDRFARRASALRARLLAQARGDLEARKRRLEVQSYDDLLLRLRQALEDPRRGEALAAALRADYPAALVDEFQDTDPIQYAILRRIWGGQGLPVFLVGDPKQAIYGFRGADVFAYLRARREAQGPYPLDVTWRAAPRLVEALNALFGR